MILVWIVTMWLASTVAVADGPRVSLVQHRVDTMEYASFSSFAREVEEPIRVATDTYDADIVVFPEYVNVFVLFSDYADCIERSATVGDALRCIGATEGEIPDIVREEVRENAGAIRNLWARLARTYDVVVVAGTVFEEDSHGQLRNRALVFGRDGRIVHAQDKVFLTDFESDILGVAPGSVTRARTFLVDGHEVGLTICRDTFFDTWETIFDDVDLWLELRANGEPYAPEVRARFERGLTERMVETDVPYGASTSLNGRFLDLIWQGPAYVVNDDGDRIAESPEVDGDFILPFTLPAEQ